MASEPPNSVVSRFGPNEWLVDEIYEQYLKDKNSVDPAWWDFFEDYEDSFETPVGWWAGILALIFVLVAVAVLLVEAHEGIASEP